MKTSQTSRNPANLPKIHTYLNFADTKADTQKGWVLAQSHPINQEQSMLKLRTSLALFYGRYKIAVL